MHRKIKHVLIAILLAATITTSTIAVPTAMAGGNGSSDSHCNGC